MPNLAEEHLELERILWSACIDRDPNEWVDLSLRICGVLDQKLRREIGDDDSCPAGCITFPASSAHWLES
ncbi:MAG: hypothetical protein DMG81_04470 [Acidobacteria bacterium]|nr:MAG: hypothetical protein DMG81_04470 [Acidobacteriota bacterium]